MYAFRPPSGDARAGLQTCGVEIKHPRLLRDEKLYDDCSDFRLTTPVIHVGMKIANGQPLSDEELGIAQGMTLKRGKKDFQPVPLRETEFGFEIEDYYGFRAVLDLIIRAGVYDDLPKEPEERTEPDQILFCTGIRVQPLSVLWDLADGIHKGHPFGAPKPWVVQDLQVLGLISIGAPISDGTRGRPPLRLIINSWGKQLVTATRKYMGVEITDDYRRAARIGPWKVRSAYTAADRLAFGYLNRGLEIPASLTKRLSERGLIEVTRRRENG